MSKLIVVAFNDETTAFTLRDRLLELQKEHIVSLEDAAVVIRKQDGKVKVKQVTSLTGAGALGGAFWGMLIGLLFLAPWLGMVVGAAAGALSGAASDIGVDDKFIKEVGNQIEPGHSAIFMLIKEATEDKLMKEFENFDGTVIQTSLSDESEEKLREAFAPHDDKKS